MQFYEDYRAPNPRRVRIFLAEKGVEVERRHIDIMSGEHKSPDMLALNPSARVPFLVLDDGAVIAETVAICRYIDALHPQPPLFGVGPREIAGVEMWQRQVENDLLVPVMQAFRHTNPRMAVLESPQVPAWGEINRARVEAMLARLDQHLAGSRFMAGERFTIADITALCTVDFMRVARFAIGPQRPALARWHAAVSARPIAGA
jgi:glutathione S-transferase